MSIFWLMMKTENHKKIAALIILVIFAVIIWHQRLPGFKNQQVKTFDRENPFINVQEVPLKLDHLEIPDLEHTNVCKEEIENLQWGKDPFRLKKE